MFKHLCCTAQQMRNVFLMCKENTQNLSYPLFTLQKSNAMILYEVAFSFKYFEYLLINVDMS